MMIDDEDAINVFFCINKNKLVEDFEITNRFHNSIPFSSVPMENGSLI
jgi:hypothetical protein